MINKLYFGQYSHKDTIVHKIDPRLKLIYVFALSVFIFTLNKYLGILFFTLFVLLIAIASKISMKKLLQSLRPFYLMFVFLLVMYLIFSRNQLNQGIVVIWRFLMLLIMSYVLTYTTTTSDLVAAIEKLMKPLKIFNIKPRNIAVMISITIRFIPAMLLQFERLRESMLARLANFRNLRHIKLIMLSALEKMFKSASNLSDAMQSRLYNENAESHKIMRLSSNDYISLLIIAVFILVIY